MTNVPSLTTYIAQAESYELPDQFIADLSFIIRNDNSFDSKTLSSAAMLYKSGMDIKKIFLILKTTMDRDQNLNLEKFYKLIKHDINKLNISAEKIQKDLHEYKQKINEIETQLVPLRYALEAFSAVNISPDKIMAILDFIVPDKSTSVEQMTVYKIAVDKIVALTKVKFPHSEITHVLEKMVDGQPNFSIEKFDTLVDAAYRAPTGKIISANDNSVKIRLNTMFLKETTENFNILKNNAKEIKQISAEHKEDKSEFANAFYNFFIQKKGYADIAPALKIIEPESPEWGGEQLGGFSLEGFINIYITPDMSQANIVEIISHELSHFEDFLLIIKTEGLGITKEAEEFVLDAFIALLGGYDKFFTIDKNLDVSPKELSNFGYETIKDHEQYNLFVKEAIKRLTDTDFYKKLMLSNYMPVINKNHPKYKIAHELSDSATTKYRPDDLYSYRTGKHETKAHLIGSSTGAAFEKLLEPDELTSQIIATHVINK